MSRFLAQSKQSSTIDTAAKIQNNYIKLSGFTFRLIVTRFLLRGKFFKPKNSFAAFYDKPYAFLPFSTL